MLREAKLQLLRGCLILPLTSDERSLMRDIVFHYERGTETTAGFDRDQVAALFEKCQGILNRVQKAAV